MRAASRRSVSSRMCSLPLCLSKRAGGDVLRSLYFRNLLDSCTPLYSDKEEKMAARCAMPKAVTSCKAARDIAP
uniref:Putative secreted protein n=1 Tax=Ixodes scapularis TaxID=6945 RepID=A0A4D5RDF7_IXOSC